MVTSISAILTERGPWLQRTGCREVVEHTRTARISQSPQIPDGEENPGGSKRASGYPMRFSVRVNPALGGERRTKQIRRANSSGAERRDSRILFRCRQVFTSSITNTADNGSLARFETRHSGMFIALYGSYWGERMRGLQVLMEGKRDADGRIVRLLA